MILFLSDLQYLFSDRNSTCRTSLISSRSNFSNMILLRSYKFPFFIVISCLISLKDMYSMKVGIVKFILDGGCNILQSESTCVPEGEQGVKEALAENTAAKINSSCSGCRIRSFLVCWCCFSQLTGGKTQINFTPVPYLYSMATAINKIIASD